MSVIPADDGIYPGIPDTVYHADRASLSSSGAKKLLPPSCPALFKHGQDNPQENKAVFDIGKVAHKMILGVGEKVVRVDAADWKTKAAQDKRKEAYAAGHIPLLKAEVDAAQRMAGAAYEHPLAAALLAEGTPELSGYWHHTETGARLRFRPDWLTELANGRVTIVDVKTSTSASPQEFSSSAAKFGYAMQRAWYCEGLRALEIADDPAFLFVVVDKNPPHLVSVVTLDDEAIAYGQRQMRRAINTYAECVEKNDWPGWPDNVHTISLPRWAYYAEENNS